MVYCDFVSKEDGKVLYSLGGSPKGLTGGLLIDINNKSFDIVKEPRNTKVYVRHITAMIARAWDDLSKGTCPKKLSYEI